MQVVKSWEDLEKVAARQQAAAAGGRVTNRRRSRRIGVGGGPEEDEEDVVLSAEDELNAKLINEDIDTTDDEEEGVMNGDGSGSKNGKGVRAGSRTASSSSTSSLVEIEDLAGMVSSAGGRAGGEQAVADATAPREMVTPLQRKSLIKEGYKIIGSHSAVKLCRWTKHQLRGRVSMMWMMMVVVR